MGLCISINLFSWCGRGFETEQINALGPLEIKTQKWHNVASATFYWSEQGTRAAKMQGLGK